MCPRSPWEVAELVLSLGPPPRLQPRLQQAWTPPGCPPQRHRLPGGPKQTQDVVGGGAGGVWRRSRLTRQHVPRVCDSCRARPCRQTRAPFSDKGRPYAQRPYARPGCVQDARGPRCLGRAVRTGSPSSLPSRLTQTRRPDQAAAEGVAMTLESSSGSRCARWEPIL